MECSRNATSRPQNSFLNSVQNRKERLRNNVVLQQANARHKNKSHNKHNSVQFIELHAVAYCLSCVCLSASLHFLKVDIFALILREYFLIGMRHVIIHISMLARICWVIIILRLSICSSLLS